MAVKGSRKRARKAAARKSRRKAARKQPARKKGTWGGARPGAGRPKGSGQGPSPDSRRNRVAVMFTDKELVVLERAARRAAVPVSTMAYRFCIQSMPKLR